MPALFIASFRNLLHLNRIGPDVILHGLLGDGAFLRFEPISEAKPFHFLGFDAGEILEGAEPLLCGGSGLIERIYGAGDGGEEGRGLAAERFVVLAEI